MTDFEKALHDPSEVYAFPRDVLLDDTLTDAQKKRVLQEWELDAREIMQADDENMAGDSPSMLQRVHAALAKLDN